MEKIKSSFEYDSSDNLKKLLDAKGNSFTYTYDSRHNPLTAKVVDPDTPADAKTAMTTKAVYTTGVSAGQYMAKQTDAAGNSTLYDWDGTKGLLDQVTDAAQDTTGYTYDGMDRLTAVTGKADVWGTAGDIRVQYAYEKDRLTRITHNGFDYVFTYNGFGRRTGVSIAGTAVISHSYGGCRDVYLRWTGQGDSGEAGQRRCNNNAVQLCV